MMQIMKERELLIEQIKAAFLNEMLPDSLYEYSDDKVDDIDDVLIFADMSLKDIINIDILKVSPPAKIKWQDVSKKMIANNITAFCYFTDESFRYYLPAVMFSSLEDNDPDMVVIDTVQCRIETIQSRDLLELNFSKQQIDVINSWLEWMSENQF